MALFAPVHRLSFNLAHGQSFDYMGPTFRRDDDSAYDTLWHSVAAKVTTYYDQGISKGKTLYQPRFDGAPFVFAVVFEVLVCMVCWVAVQHV